MRKMMREGALDEDHLIYELGDVLYHWACPAARVGRVGWRYLSRDGWSAMISEMKAWKSTRFLVCVEWDTAAGCSEALLVGKEVAAARYS
jgi:hypothetical protein